MSAPALHDARTLDPGDRVPITCKSCSHTRTSTTNSARAAGWRIGDGVAWCPPCWRGDPVPFRAECSTCGWSTDDDDPHEALDEKAARYEARYHECEPDVRVERVES